MATIEPYVSVVVPHYSDLQGLDRCLAALRRQSYPSDMFEIIVADNASPEGEAAVAMVIAGRARLVVVSEKGAANARNGGVKAARGAVLAFTDADCVPDTEWLIEGLVELIRCDLVGGRVSVLVNDPQRMTACEAFETVFAFDNERYIREMAFSVTANLFCQRKTFYRVGGFAETGVSEDVEWCQRAQRAGYLIKYAPRCIVGHPARESWAALTSKWRRLNKEAFQLRMQKGGSARWSWIARSLALPVSALAHSPRALLDSRLETASSKVSALCVLHRLRWWRMRDALRLAYGTTLVRRSNPSALQQASE